MAALHVLCGKVPGGRTTGGSERAAQRYLTAGGLSPEMACNGRERCHASGSIADARGCSPGNIPCTGAQVCNAALSRCDTVCPDADSDGHTSTACGGDDCGESGGNRYPGNHEVCDNGSHDEDCDPLTFGFKDDDGDGETDARCCNIDATGAWHCGTDANDSNYQIRRGSQVCDGDRVFTDRFMTTPCPAGTVCIPQPNGQGFCGVAPPGYKAPPRITSDAAAEAQKPLPTPKIVKPRTGPVPPRPRLTLPSLSGVKR